MQARTVKIHSPVYLDSAGEVSKFVRSAVNGADVIAVDTEGASFHRFIDRIYLLQLSTRELTAVIDPLPIGRPESLGELLEDPKVEVVFHDADYDLRLLHQDYAWHVRNIFDTRIAAQLLGIKAFGLAALLEHHVGVKLDKKHQRADWSMRPLPKPMLEYAAQDTMHLITLRDRLADALGAKGRMAWAREEFARLEGTQWDTADEALAFLRMKGARDLTRRELAVLRELVHWRDDVARVSDRATFRVVGNDALLEAARRQPASKRELAQIKGAPPRMVEQRGDEILAAVRRGMEMPESELPRFPRAQRWERDPNFDARVAALKGVRDDVAKALELDPGVLCPRDRLEAVARRDPASPEQLAEVPELRSWQAEVLGERFLAALRSVPRPK